jgi:hypothetical protein
LDRLARADQVPVAVGVVGDVIWISASQKSSAVERVGAFFSLLSLSVGSIMSVAGSRSVRS